MILNQKVLVTVSSNTKDYYLNLGYNAEYRKPLYVNPEDLKDNSMAYEERICDSCGKKYGSSHQALLKSFKSFGEDICPSCVKLDKYREIRKAHIKNTNLKKYGCIAPACNKEVQQKIENTNLQKYGVKSTLQTQEVQEKIKESLVEHFGVDNPLKSPTILQKAQNTNLEKYGCKNPLQNDTIKEKMVQTNLSKYGVKYTTQSKEVRKKMRESLYKNGSVATSSQQLSIFNQIKDLYPECDCILNFLLGKYFLDIYLKYNEILIDIEYDGGYWHQDEQKDEQRDLYVKSCNYKILRIKSNNKLPSNEQLVDCIEKLVQCDEDKVELFL